MVQTEDPILEIGEPLVRQALEALRAYHDARDGGAPAEEVERLRQIAESASKSLSIFQRDALHSKDR
ncbi:hypothetical protein OC929_03820 [Pseudomonas peradeniyensis]|uniref:Uncharacterized protein n=1 Tax=Pseudomonas peradeniyensis TaxID=2745488 RepID=A0ABT2V649_9PSED|nr:hypothetical protein [Pseudomonas peradeniyensis]MCU7237167.1 hypothetical protein [Pseudomonas peradeniyensis]